MRKTFNYRDDDGRDDEIIIRKNLPQTDFNHLLTKMLRTAIRFYNIAITAGFFLLLLFVIHWILRPRF